jgi:hypothetical protein
VIALIIWAGRWLASALNISAWITVPIVIAVIIGLPLFWFNVVGRSAPDAETPSDDTDKENASSTEHPPATDDDE